MRNWILFVPALMLAGCAFVFTDVNTNDFSSVKPGMSAAEITGSLGAPFQTSKETVAGKEYEIWVYPVDKIHPSAASGKRIGVSDYEVLFMDGKVDQWRKTRTIAQPGYQAPTKAIKAD